MGNRIFFSFLFSLISITTVLADGFNSIARSNSSLKKALEATKKKDFRQAVNAYEEALRENPDPSGQIHLNLAHACFQSGMMSKAKKNYETALPALPNNNQKSAACLQLGNIFSKEKDYKAALEWYRKSLLFNPDSQKARLNYELAWRLQKQKDSEQKKSEPERDPKKKKDQNQSKQENEKQQQQDKKQNQEQNQQDSNQQKEQEKSRGKNPQGREDEKGNSEDTQEQESRQKGKDAKESNPSDKGENAREKVKESNMDDPDAFRMDKKKLKESGLTEEQARNMLQAMRQSEVKYLQQKRFKGKSSSKEGRRW